MLDLTSFLKFHRIHTPEINHLYEESEYPSKIVNFEIISYINNKEPQPFDLCFKNQKNYLRCSGRQVQLIKNNQMVFDRLISTHFEDVIFKPKIRHVKYSKELDSFFFCYKTELYSKNLDPKKPELLFSAKSSRKKITLVKCLRLLNRLLICLEDEVWVFNPERKKLELNLSEHFGYSRKQIMIDCLLIGSNPGKITAIAVDSLLCLTMAPLRKSTQQFELFRTDLVPLSSGRNFPKEIMAICNQNRFLLVETESYQLFEIGQKSIRLVRILQFPTKINPFSSSSPVFYGPVLSHHLIFVQAFSEATDEQPEQNRDNSLHKFIGVIDFNTRTGELTFHRTHLEVDGWESNRSTIRKLDGEVYLVDHYGDLLHLVNYYFRPVHSSGQLND